LIVHTIFGTYAILTGWVDPHHWHWKSLPEKSHVACGMTFFIELSFYYQSFIFGSCGASSSWNGFFLPKNCSKSDHQNTSSRLSLSCCVLKSLLNSCCAFWSCCW
jgi:hypothetical protein